VTTLPSLPEQIKLHFAQGETIMPLDFAYSVRCPRCGRVIKAEPRKIDGEYHDLAHCRACGLTYNVCCDPQRIEKVSDWWSDGEAHLAATRGI
jgi:hypothetical protein